MVVAGAVVIELVDAVVVDVVFLEELDGAARTLVVGLLVAVVVVVVVVELVAINMVNSEMGMLVEVGGMIVVGVLVVVVTAVCNHESGSNPRCYPAFEALGRGEASCHQESV